MTEISLIVTLKNQFNSTQRIHKITIKTNFKTGNFMLSKLYDKDL